MPFAPLNNQMRKKIEDYSYGLTDLIGKGFSSSVFRGINQKTKEQVAIKVIDLKTINKSKTARSMLEGEVDALKKLTHINILRCFDIYSTVNNYYIITEFCNQGDLEHLLRKREKLPEEEAIPIFRDLINAFKYIAESGYLHRDLKPANILLRDKIAKVADFGFAKRASINPKETVNVGSPLYMSPEALKSNIYTVKNDIWSLGVILYEILHGKAPWESSTEKELIVKISTQSFNLNRNLSEDTKDFIRKCLVYDENKRLNLSQLSNHPFVLRITEQFGMPQLLRKQTVNDVEQAENHSRDKKSLQKNYVKVENLPTSIHHREGLLNSNKTNRQMLSQMNFMRFLYRLQEMFPSDDTNRYTVGLRFIIVKQMLSQLHNLKESLDHENRFNFEGWEEHLANQEKMNKYKIVLSEYTKKYEKHSQELEKWVGYVRKDSRLVWIANTDLQRSETLSIMAVNFAIEQCRRLRADLSKTIQGPEAGFGEKALRLDFLMTFYQLNCLLVDAFDDPEYFARNSKLDAIIQNRPVPLSKVHLPELQNKLRALQIIK